LCHETQQRLVVVLPDSVRNYMTKFLNDSWMVDHEFMAPPQRGEWWATKTVSDLTLQTPLTVNPDVTCERAVSILKSHGFNQLPVVEADGTIAGMLTLGNLMQQVRSATSCDAIPCCFCCCVAVVKVLPARSRSASSCSRYVVHCRVFIVLFLFVVLLLLRYEVQRRVTPFMLCLSAHTNLTYITLYHCAS
jgi:hypothetical protein